MNLEIKYFCLVGYKKLARTLAIAKTLYGPIAINNMVLRRSNQTNVDFYLIRFNGIEESHSLTPV